MRELHLDPMAGAWGAAGPVGPAAAPEQPTQARGLPAPRGGSWDLRPWPAPGLGLGPPRTWPLGRSGCSSGPAQESGAGQTERRGPGDRVGQHRKCGASPPPCPRLEWPVGHQLRAAPRGGATALPVGGRGQRLWGPLPTEGLSFQSGRGASQLEGLEPAQSQLTLRPTLGR